MDRAEYVFYKLAQKTIADENKLTTIDPTKYLSTEEAAKELREKATIPAGYGFGAVDPNNTNSNYLISYMARGAGDKINKFDILSSKKWTQGFNPEWQGRIDIPNLSKQVMKHSSDDFPTYSSVGKGWKSELDLYRKAQEREIGYNPAIAYNVGKNRYLGVGSFVPPVKQKIDEIKADPLKELDLNTKIDFGAPKVDHKFVHSIPPKEPFTFASSVPWLGILGGYLGGRFSAKGGEGLHSLKDANWWTRATNVKGERFGGERPLSTTFGTLAGLGLGLGLDYGVPWVSNKLFGTNYPAGTTASNVIGDQLYSAGKFAVDKIGKGVNWVGDQISNIFK